MCNNKEDDDADYVDTNRVEEMMEDIEDILRHQPEYIVSLVNDSKKLLYPGCNDQFSGLSTTLKLCKLKVKNGWSDKSFTELLKLFGSILPLNNELPTSTYEAKKILRPIGMTIKNIHACPNDCVLFRNGHEHLNTCRKCGASRYKRDGNYFSANVNRRPLVKVLWYSPIVELLKRLFGNINDAKLMRWHVEGRKQMGCSDTLVTLYSEGLLTESSRNLIEKLEIYDSDFVLEREENQWRDFKGKLTQN